MHRVLAAAARRAARPQAPSAASAYARCLSTAASPFVPPPPPGEAAGPFAHASNGSGGGLAHHANDLLSVLQLQDNLPGRPIYTAIPRRLLCSETGLQLRDLRVVDPSFRSSVPALLVRRDAIVISLEHVKCIIMSKKVLVFDWSSPSVRQLLLPDLMRSLGASHSEAEYRGPSATGAGGPSKDGAAAAALLEAGGRASPSAPGAPAPPPPPAALAATSDGPPGWLHPSDSSFEFRALSSALESIVARLGVRSRTLAPEVQSLVSALQGKGMQSPEDAPLRLVTLNTQLARLASDVEDVRDALAGLLESDEDLGGLYLSRGAAARREGSDHEEAELLLEGYARSVEEVMAELDALRDSMRFTESYVRTRLDAARNELLRLDTLLTMGTLSLAAGGLICAAFGMNLQMPGTMETSNLAFIGVSAAAGATTGGVFVGLYSSARRTLRSV